MVCADDGTGGTWAGAREAMRRHFGRVAVWTGPGAGPGNAKLVELGGIAIDDVSCLADLGDADLPPPATKQASLFD